MSHMTTAIDCRGLGAALAVLRIKQAIHAAPEHALPLQARLGEGCAADAVAAGLRAQACDVRLVRDERTLLAETSALAARRNLALPAHV